MNLIGKEINKVVKDAYFTRQINHFVTDWGVFENWAALEKESNKRGEIISYDRYDGSDNFELVGYVYSLGQSRDISELSEFIRDNGFEIYYENKEIIILDHPGISQDLKQKIFNSGGEVLSNTRARIRKTIDTNSFTE